MANTKKLTLSDEEFSKIVSDSTSIRQVIEKCGLIPAGGNYNTISNKIKANGLNTSHFTGSNWRVGRKFPTERKPIEFYLNNHGKINSHNLRLRLIEEGLKNSCCERCGLHTWQDVQIPLELHHIDGNHINNNLANLQILCPNCHALTPNYGSRNKRLKA